MTKVRDHLDFNEFRSSTSHISRIEDELFEFTSGRWPYNERSQREAKKTPFNVEASRRVGCVATGASAVTRISKTSESFNRVFLVKFENGSETIARFPSQNGRTATLCYR